jgi:hypothetical protein
MASFPQSQSERAFVAWLYARSETSRLDPCHLPGDRTPGGSTLAATGEPSVVADRPLAKVLVAVKRLLAERDDASAWLLPSGVRKDTHLSHSAPGARGKGVPTRPDGTGVLPRGDQASKSVWGSWQ